MPERVTQGRALKLARIAPLLLLLAAMLCSGCSALGLVGGRLLDAPHHRPLRVDAYMRLSPGDDIRLELLDGRRVGGHLLAVRHAPAGDSLAVAVVISQPSRPITVADPVETRVYAVSDLTSLTHAARHEGASRAGVGFGIGVLLDFAAMATFVITIGHHTTHL